MRNQRGITLMTLIIYVIGLTIILGIVTVITNFFYQNVLKMEDNSKTASQYSKFNIAFLEEVKTYGNKVERLDDEGNSVLNTEKNYVKFTSGNTYIFQDEKVYKNKIAIANNITDFSFKVWLYDAKEVISVKMKIGDVEQIIDYVLPNIDEIKQ